MALESTPKRAVHRSPRYPGLKLSDAIEKIRVVYDKDKRSLARPDVVVGHLGMAPGSGGANRILSALKQYGLLDEQAGQLRVSESAFRILHMSESSPERLQAIRDAAIAPQIIKEIISEYPDGLPSDPNLSDFLLNQKGFNPDSISFFIRVLRSNLALAGLGQAGYGSDDDSEGPRSVLLQQDAQVAHPPVPTFYGGGSMTSFRSPQVLVASGVQYAAPEQFSVDPSREFSDPLTYPLSKDCMGVVRFRGAPTQGDIERLIRFLDLSKLAFPESAPESPDGPRKRITGNDPGSDSEGGGAR